MKVESLEQKIAKQEERLKQLKAQKQAVLARENKKQSEQKRKDDTRRKILAGSFVLDYIEKESGDFEKNEFYKNLNSFLTKDSDKKLFNL